MEILNTRELAFVIWFVAFFVWATWKANAWPLLKGLVRSFCKPIILRCVGIMGAYVAFTTWFLAEIGLWKVDNLKTTLIWFVTFSLGWMFDTNRWDANPNNGVRTTLKEILSATTFVTFLVEFYTFNLAAELFIVPTVTFIAVIGTFAQGRQGHETVAKVFRTLLTTIGIALIAYAAYRLIGDLRGFATEQNGREFAVPGLLSLLFIPFMYAFNIYIGYETAFRTLPTRLREGDVGRYAFRRAVLAFGLDVMLMRRWKAALYQTGAATREQVDGLIASMKAAKRRERDPPQIEAKDGWSPYAATDWLRGVGLAAQGYNPLYGNEWGASSPYRKLQEEVLSDSLSYYIRGNERAATKLTLMLNRDPRAKETPKASLDALSEALLMLLAGAFGEKAARAARGLKNRRHRTTEGFATLVLTDDDFTIKLTITHKAHIELY